jgi:hypothetical protein
MLTDGYKILTNLEYLNIISIEFEIIEYLKKLTWYRKPSFSFPWGTAYLTQDQHCSKNPAGLQVVALIF